MIFLDHEYMYKLQAYLKDNIANMNLKDFDSLSGRGENVFLMKKYHKNIMKRYYLMNFRVLYDNNRQA